MHGGAGGGTLYRQPWRMNTLKSRLWLLLLFFIIILIPLFGCFWAFRMELGYIRNREMIDFAALRYQVPPRLVAAVIWQETRFNPLCRGKAGEIGLMQVMPASAREWAKGERINSFDSEFLFDPKTNILAGTWYLGRAIRRWQAQSDPFPYALAEYNAGRSNAIRWDRNTISSNQEFADAISYPTTRFYVKTVLRNYHSFGQPWKRWRCE